MTDQTAQILWLMLAIAFVGSGLIARRIPMMRLIRWSAVWVALLFGVYLLFRMIEPDIIAWQQGRRGGEISMTQDSGADGGAMQEPDSLTASGATVRIPMSDDGHYWVDAMVNGQSVRFLIDSGASITAISQQTASALALLPDPSGSMVAVQTANGPVSAERSILPDMEIGAIRARDLPIIVSPSFGTVNVLGMNFLNKLKSWRVESGEMVLEPG